MISLYVWTYEWSCTGQKDQVRLMNGQFKDITDPQDLPTTDMHGLYAALHRLLRLAPTMSYTSTGYIKVTGCRSNDNIPNVCSSVKVFRVVVGGRFWFPKSRNSADKQSIRCGMDGERV